MIRLQNRQVMALHHLVTKETGGDPALRDGALLDSALAAAYQTFDGADLYPTIEEKAARLGFSLIANHAFVDGNKRIGVLVLLTFLAINGAPLRVSDEDVIKIGIGVAAGTMKYDELLAFIRARRGK